MDNFWSIKQVEGIIIDTGSNKKLEVEPKYVIELLQCHAKTLKSFLQNNKASGFLRLSLFL